MPSIIDALPGQAQKDALLDGFRTAITPDALGLDALGELNAGQVAGSFPVDELAAQPEGELPALPPGLSRTSVQQQLQEPLLRIRAINAAALFDDLERKPLATMPKPTFRISETAGQITAAILPSFTIAPPDLLPGSFSQEFFDLSALAQPLDQLARVGANSPLHVLDVLLNTLASVVHTVGDADKMAAFAAQSLRDIYMQQIACLDARLPLVAVESAIAICDAGVDESTESDTELDAELDAEPDAGGVSFAAQYALLLNELEILDDGQPARVRRLERQAANYVLPALQTLEDARITLNLLHANDVAALERALAGVLDVNAADPVFLAPYLDAVGRRAGQILDAIAGPINQIRRMAQQIQRYLEQAATTAEEGAQRVAQRVAATLQQIEQWIQEIERRILDIQTEITSFVEKLDISTIIEKAKLGCAKVGEYVDAFVTKVEALKLKLDAAVQNLGPQVDEKVSAAFALLEQNIRALLERIVATLRREDVQAALKQARDGIAQFTNTIDQASLQPIFDLVIDKTHSLEESIKRIDPARMNVPQRTALKVSNKVLQEVRVDEIIKPELMEAFEEIREPLAAIIQLLRDKVLLIEQQIEMFQPGALISELIQDSGPYQLLIHVLDECKPSLLLAPLKELNGKVTEIAASLDPNRVVAQVQGLYEKLVDLLAVLDPAPLSSMIGGGLDAAAAELADIRDRKLGQLEDKVRATISLERLMAGTGIQEIADAEFWQIMMKILGGDYLDVIKQAMDGAEARLAGMAGMLDYEQPLLALEGALVNVERQRRTDAPLLALRLAELKNVLTTDRFQQLQNRRTDLLARAMAPGSRRSPEVIKLLRDLDLASLLQLQASAPAFAKTPKTRLRAALAAVDGVLAPQIDALQQVDAAAIQAAAAIVFRKQIGDPLRQLIDLLQAKLQPFKETAAAIQGIVDTILALPGRIDASVATVLATTRASTGSVITQIIQAIQTAGAALTGVLENIYAGIQRNVDLLSPAWILNSFAPGDFAPAGLAELAARIVAAAPAAPASATSLEVAVDSTTAGSTAAVEDAAVEDAAVEDAGAETAAADGAAAGADGEQAPVESLSLEAQLCALLTDTELGVLKAGVERRTAEPEAPLHEGAVTVVVKALNQFMAAATVLDSAFVDGAKAAAETRLADLQALLASAAADPSVSGEELIVLRKQTYRLGALSRQILAAEAAYQDSGERYDLLRLNRVLLEVSYPNEIGVSLQSLHPYVVELIAHLYPVETVQRLDDIHAGVMAKVKQLPEQLVSRPLDEAYAEVVQILKEHFDISSIFDVLETKLDGMDEDLALGLDRLSVAYTRVLVTLDQRLAAE